MGLQGLRVLKDLLDPCHLGNQLVQMDPLFLVIQTVQLSQYLPCFLEVLVDQQSLKVPVDQHHQLLPWDLQNQLAPEVLAVQKDLKVPQVQHLLFDLECQQFLCLL